MSLQAEILAHVAISYTLSHELITERTGLEVSEAITDRQRTLIRKLTVTNKELYKRTLNGPKWKGIHRAHCRLALAQARANLSILLPGDRND